MKTRTTKQTIKAVMVEVATLALGYKQGALMGELFGKIREARSLINEVMMHSIDKKIVLFAHENKLVLDALRAELVSMDVQEEVAQVFDLKEYKLDKGLVVSETRMIDESEVPQDILDGANEIVGLLELVGMTPEQRRRHLFKVIK